MYFVNQSCQPEGFENGRKFWCINLQFTGELTPLQSAASSIKHHKHVASKLSSTLPSRSTKRSFNKDPKSCSFLLLILSSQWLAQSQSYPNPPTSTP